MPLQVMSIFSVTNGLIDAVAVSDVRQWEREFHAFMAARYPQVADKIGKEKAISKETDAEMRRGIEEFTKDFLAAREKK
jgi:F-type H+-transporting ATPase subunit alpha